MSLLAVWLVWLIAFPVIEGYALWRKNDKAYPLTHYVREFMRVSPFLRVGVLAGIVWVFLHFAIGFTL